MCIATGGTGSIHRCRLGPAGSHFCTPSTPCCVHLKHQRFGTPCCLVEYVGDGWSCPAVRAYALSRVCLLVWMMGV